MTSLSSKRNALLDKYGARNADGILDRFTNLRQVADSLRAVGLEQAALLVGIDYSESNLVQGEYTFGGKCLHTLNRSRLNPYQRAILTLGETLEPFDDDGIIPAFGFADSRTKDRSVFPLAGSRGNCKGFREVFDAYNELTLSVELGGPASFAPIILKAIDLVRDKGQYHILVIISDGRVRYEDSVEALVEASKWPISIIVVGVGDGPWTSMREFDDALRNSGRRFDNFQFVDFDKVTRNARNPEAAFALHALMEIPDQFLAIKRLGLLKAARREALAVGYSGSGSASASASGSSLRDSREPYGREPPREYSRDYNDASRDLRATAPSRDYSRGDYPGATASIGGSKSDYYGSSSGGGASSVGTRDYGVSSSASRADYGTREYGGAATSNYYDRPSERHSHY